MDERAKRLVWHVYADGAARGNPGPAAVGVVIVAPDGREVRRIRKKIGERTNNQAEYEALIVAMRELPAYRPRSVRVTMDSQLVVDQMHGTTKTKEPALHALRTEVGRLIELLRAEVQYAWAERKVNHAADRLCNRALDGEDMDWAVEVPLEPTSRSRFDADDPRAARGGYTSGRIAMPGGPSYPTLVPMFEELVGARLLLRPYRPDDAVAFQASVAESRDHLRPWEDFADAFQTVEEARDWIVHRQASWLVRERFSMGMWRSETGRYLGGLELWPRGSRGWRLPAFELAYWVRASEQGRGYVTEGVRLLVDYAFEALGAQRVEIGIDAKNARSVAVAQRCGFVLEGRLRHTGIELDGTLVDNLIFALIPTDLPRPHGPPSP